MEWLFNYVNYDLAEVGVYYKDSLRCLYGRLILKHTVYNLHGDDFFYEDFGNPLIFLWGFKFFEIKVYMEFLYIR